VVRVVGGGEVGVVTVEVVVVVDGVVVGHASHSTGHSRRNSCPDSPGLMQSFTSKYEHTQSSWQAGAAARRRTPAPWLPMLIRAATPCTGSTALPHVPAACITKQHQRSFCIPHRPFLNLSVGIW
jgi:hypothetical protein